jgi:hypothetical protein
MKIETQIKKLLESVFWLPTLKTGEYYQRYEDDSPEGFVAVTFSSDGDGHVTLSAMPDPKEHGLYFRFRMPMTGGGQSPRVRNALLILAEAIRLDNEERPQDRRHG